MIRIAFIHNYGDRTTAGEMDGRAIGALGAALAGTGRIPVTSSGTAHPAAGQIVTDDDEPDPGAPSAHRIASEAARLAMAPRGVWAMLVRGCSRSIARLRAHRRRNGSGGARRSQG